MADLEKLKQNLQKNGFEVTHFATAAQAELSGGSIANVVRRCAIRIIYYKKLNNLMLQDCINMEKE